jgi:subtilase family protein
MPNEYRTLLASLLAAACVSLLGATAGNAELGLPAVPIQTCVPVISVSTCGGSSTAQPAESGGDESRLLVRVRPGFSSGSLDPLLSSLGATIERSLWQISVLALRVPAANEEQTLRVLQRHPDIEEVEQEAFVSALDASPNDAHWPGQWGVKRAGFPTAWATTRGSGKTIVAVVDTGIETSHPDLRAALLAGRDFVDGDSTPSDEHGHGTAVAGVLAARTNNHAGIAGVCWNCRVLPVRVLDRDGSGDSATLADGIIWAVDQGADVINLSLGGDTTTIAEDGALAYAVRHDVVLVAAAGNEGRRTREYPAADRRVIAVAASDPSDRLYPWSNRGEWVDISAPGCNTSRQLRELLRNIFCDATRRRTCGLDPLSPPPGNGGRNRGVRPAIGLARRAKARRSACISRHRAEGTHITSQPRHAAAGHGQSTRPRCHETVISSTSPKHPARRFPTPVAGACHLSRVARRGRPGCSPSVRDRCATDSRPGSAASRSLRRGR